MNCNVITLCAFVVSLTLCSAPRAAVPISGALRAADLKDPIEKGSRITYLDLLRNPFPDLQMDETRDVAVAHRSVRIRSIGAKGKSTLFESDIEIKDFEPCWIRSEGRRLLLLSVDLSSEDANQGTPYEGEATVLAAFRVEPSIELLDAMDIRTDKFTAFWERPSVLRLDGRSDAFLVYSTHSNAGESYEDLRVMFVDRGRFKVIANLFFFNTQACGATFSETPYFRILPRPGRKYPSILVRVKLKKHADTAGCDRRTGGYTRYYQGIYSWNHVRSRYEGKSDQLDKLDRFNRDRL